jgi:SAM-dependent methyltransferase
VLDLGCGGGDQAKVFAQKGYQVVGIDIAPSLIEFASRQFQENALSGTFRVGDMRSIDFNAEFDLCVLLSGTFGFFGDREDQEVLSKVCRATRPGGKAFVSFLAPPRSNEHVRRWQETGEGWELSEEWFDTEISSRCSRVMLIQRDGTVIVPEREQGYHANETIRCYSVPEIQRMMNAAGLRYCAAFSSNDLSVPPKPLGPAAVRNIAVAERP